MPIIRINYNKESIQDKDISILSFAIQKIVQDVTSIEDVCVYASSPDIQVKTAPIEVFVEMSAHKIVDATGLIGEIKNAVSRWKKENNFEYLINLTLIPMDWKIEIGI